MFIVPIVWTKFRCLWSNSFITLLLHHVFIQLGIKVWLRLPCSNGIIALATRKRYDVVAINDDVKTYASELTPPPPSPAGTKENSSNDNEKPFDLQRWRKTGELASRAVYLRRNEGRDFNFTFTLTSFHLTDNFRSLSVRWKWTLHRFIDQIFLKTYTLFLILPYCCRHGNEIISMDNNNKAVTEIQRPFNSTRCWETNFRPLQTKWNAL